MTRRLIVWTLLLSLTSFRCAVPRPCGAPAEPLATHFEEWGEDVWFEDAIVYAGYHYSSIAPMEVLKEKSPYFAYRLNIAEEGCLSANRLGKIVRRSVFSKISGRGHYDVQTFTFVLSCVCKMEPLPQTPELHRAMEPSYGR